MKAEPLISAIIVNYHNCLLTAKAAASVLADQPDAQVIVVDNSEDEHEAQALRAVLHHQAICLIAPKNLGFGKGCNLGLEHARHEWILLLNPDASVLQGCIAELLSFLQNTPQAGAASPQAYWDSEQTWLLPPAQLPTPATELMMALALGRPWLGSLISRWFRRWAISCIRSERPVMQKMLSGGVVMLRRSALSAAGGLFDPDFFMYYEDTDLCRRLGKAGFKLYLVPTAKAIHAWESSPGKAALSTESRFLYFQKQFPSSLLFRLRIRLESNGLPIHPPASSELGICLTAPVLSVPPVLQDAWTLEISPHPLLVPALYCLGSGKQCPVSEEIWALLGPGDYWMRLAGPACNTAARFHFIIK